MTTAELIRIAAKRGVIVSPVAAAVLVGDTKPRVHRAESYGVDPQADTRRNERREAVRA